MKKLFFISRLMVMALIVNVGFGFARNLKPDEAQRIMDRLKNFDPNAQSNWEPTGPTEENILAATRVDNLAAKGSREETLINAAKSGDHKNVRTLIAAGVGLEARDPQDRTALMRAAEKGHSDVVRILLEAGAHMSAKDKFGWTAFFMAADQNQVNVVKMLVARGAASEQSFEDLFVRSVFQGNVEMVKAFVGEGAQISCNTIDAAYGVVNYRNTEMVNLIKHLKSQCKRSEIND